MNYTGTINGRLAASNKLLWSDRIEFVDAAGVAVVAFDAGAVLGLRRCGRGGAYDLLSTGGEMVVSTNTATWSFSAARMKTLTPGAYDIEIKMLRGADITLIRGCVDIHDGIVE